MYELDGIAEFYEVFVPLLKEANEVSCRGLKTKELLGVSFKIKNPRQRLVWFRGRMFNVPFAITEALMLVNKSNKVSHIAAFNENMKQFSDDGETFYGSYGRRISEHIPLIIQKLKEDPTTRQAVLTIHQVQDSTADTKDVPCTIALQFMIRDEALNLHVYMRSNDAIWGTPYDVFNFTMLQEVVANTLGISLGEYYHTASSLHVYERHYDMLDKIELALETLQYSPAIIPYFGNYEAYMSNSNLLVDCLDANCDIASTVKYDEENWLINTLAACQSKFDKIYPAIVPLQLQTMVKEYIRMKGGN